MVVETILRPKYHDISEKASFSRSNDTSLQQFELSNFTADKYHRFRDK
jgi:hypothetical protein